MQRLLLLDADRAGPRIIAVGDHGYIVLSDDNGRSWQPPLYTGLAERFPYVVRPASALPLRKGDTIQLDVVIAEIDTATISYPPVGLRTNSPGSPRKPPAIRSSATRSSRGPCGGS